MVLLGSMLPTNQVRVEAIYMYDVAIFDTVKEIQFWNYLINLKFVMSSEDQSVR